MAYTKYYEDWKDFPNTDTPITAEALDHIEDGIYQNSIEIDDLKDNLPTEIVTGQIKPTNEWVDGKRVYVKRFNVGPLKNNDVSVVAHGLNLAQITVTKLAGTAKSPSNVFCIPMPSAFPIMLYLTNDNLQVETTSDRTMFTTCYVDIYFYYNS
jgi:hypothetical protein